MSERIVRQFWVCPKCANENQLIDGPPKPGVKIVCRKCQMALTVNAPEPVK